MEQGLHDQSEDFALRILIGVHGHEPAGWAARACRLVSAWRDATVCVLGVVDVPSPPFTSLIAPARRLHGAAREGWRQDEERRVREVIDRVLSSLKGQVEVVRAQSSERGLADTIEEHALSWRADVVLVAAPTRLSHSWVWPGRVHDRLLRRGTGAVLAVSITPPPHRTARVFRLAQLMRASRATSRGATPAFSRLVP